MATRHILPPQRSLPLFQLGKNWFIHAPELGGAARLNDLDRQLFEVEDDLIHELLVRRDIPNNPSINWHSDLYGLRDSAHGKSPMSIVPKLPLELHCMILDHLESEDALSYGLALPALWPIASRKIRKEVASLRGAWAGKALVGMSMFDKFPLNCRTTHHFRMLDNQPSRAHLRDLLCQMRDKQDTEPLSKLRALQNAMEQRALAHYHDERTVVFDPRDVEAAISAHPNDGYVTQHPPWVLRNLTTKEYVRADALPTKASIKCPKRSVYWLGRVVLVRTSFAMRFIPGLNLDKSMGKGVWAGHRFDITTQAHHNALQARSKHDWQDVSDEVVQEITGIWKLQFGSDWWTEWLKHW